MYCFHIAVPVRPKLVARQERESVVCKLGRRALGVDYGLSRIGVAVSVGIQGRDHRVLHIRDRQQAASQVADIAQASLCADIVLGLPLTHAGERGEQASATLAFADCLVEHAAWARILLIDERFTTAEADSALKELGLHTSQRQHVRDAWAAAEILRRHFADEEAPAEVFYEPPEGTRLEACIGSANLMSYADWKKRMMDSANQRSEELRWRDGKSQNK